MINWIVKNSFYFIVAIFVAAFVSVFLLSQKNCGGGYDSEEYIELKGKFEAYKAVSEEKYSKLEKIDAKTKKENTALRDEIDELEIAKGLALADTADANKEIFEKDRELAELREREAEIVELPELVLNLRYQISTLQGKIILKDTAAIGLTGALAAANKQIVKLEGIIFKKDELIAGLWISLAAERVARMTAEAAMAAGEKNTFFFKVGKVIGNGFKIYGAYAAGRDLLRAGE